MIKYTRFYVHKNVNDYNIKINKVLHTLRCFMKKIFNKKLNNYNFMFKPIINEINYIKPNNKLIHGSLIYQLNQQKFNKIPPRNLLPMENIINKTFLIKEKADGILSVNINLDIFPELENYEVKAEFIEELNTYFVFDINIPNTTIYERQNYLRNMHYFTKNKILYNNIDNFQTFINELKNERLLLSDFYIKNNNNNIKWYPKASWNVTIDNLFYKELINIISESSTDLYFIINGVFKNDGLILTPLDGSREIKIKPKFLQTIDLLYTGKEWIDNDNISWNNIIMLPDVIYNKLIYRCYPQSNNTYIAKDIRYEKKYPNSNQIVNLIQNIYNFYWTSNNIYSSPIYYDNINHILTNNNNKYLISLINNNNNILYELIKSLNPIYNKKWLDLGCGKCKLYHYIKNKYIIKKYTGIDHDFNVLSKSINLIDNIFNIYPIDLNILWNNNIWNTFDLNIKYDYIIANFSIMYFFTDIFWLQLNNIVHKDSIFIFNFIIPNSLWKYKDSYLYSDNEYTKFKFEWNNFEHKEPVMNEEKLNLYLKLYNWTIINEYTNDNNPLSKCYKWIIIKKN
jgi:hypothetical protein